MKTFSSMAHTICLYRLIVALEANSTSSHLSESGRLSAYFCFATREYALILFLLLLLCERKTHMAHGEGYED